MTPAAVKLLMKISACRLDESIAPTTFVDMLLELVELTHETAVEECLGTDDIPPGGAPARPLRPSDKPKPKESVVPRWKVLGHDGPCEDCDGDVCTMNCGPARTAVSVSAASNEAAKSNTGADNNPGRRKDGTTWSRKPKLTDEDREAIRADYQRAKADGDTISEWMEMTALEYGVATNTLKNVCYRQGD